MENKERLDIYLVKKGYFYTRQKAKYEIENGNIIVNNKVITKSSKQVSEEDEIKILENSLKYVSKGGLKLEKAINEFGIDLKNKICMDIGASTGGFTDVMLKNGAKKVYAVDVGHNQLDKSLINNIKVINMEGTNIKDLSNIESLDFISTDVSFISITKVISKIYEFLKNKGKAVILIKPQFEAGKQYLNKNGIVKDKKIHVKVLNDIIKNIHELGFEILNIDYSPIKGAVGNIEYLVYIEKNERHKNDIIKLENQIKELVEISHKKLK